MPGPFMEHDMNNQLTLGGHEPSDLLKSAKGLSAEVSQLVSSLQTAKTPLELLKVAVDAGLTYADCLDHFGVDSSRNAFAQAAQVIYADKSDNNIEIDRNVIISRCENGAFVTAQVFVGDHEAGLPGIVDLVDLLLQHIKAFEGDGFAENKPAQHDKVGMLESTFSSLSEEIEELSGKSPDVVPKARFVFAGHVEECHTSDVILELVGLGESSGFDASFCEAIRNWIEYKGKLLDASLGTARMN